MAATTAHPNLRGCGWWRPAARAAAVGVLALASIVLVSIATAPSAFAQRGSIVSFPQRPKPAQAGSGLLGAKKNQKDQMMVRATEMHYDYTNERIAAVGNVQIYYSGSTLEADKVMYDQKTKRLHAQGNVRLTEADGKVVYGEVLDLSDDFRDGFVDSLRIDGPEQTRFAATRGERTSGDVTVFQNGVYTACEPCKEDPQKPPKWQIKASRIIHDQGEKMMYFEDARFEFFGVPLAYIPYFSSADPSAKRKSGFLVPTYHTSSVYGVSVATPYYFALAPDYDATITPMITTKQGPLVQAEWRQRLINGSYMVRASGIFQLDKQAFADKGDFPGNRDIRGHVESSGQFRLNDAGLCDVTGVPAGPWREELLRHPGDVLLWLLQPGQPAPDPGHSSSPGLRLRRQEPIPRRRGQPAHQPDQPESRSGILRPDQPQRLNEWAVLDRQR
jgi:LPS-assembly protein